MRRALVVALCLGAACSSARVDRATARKLAETETPLPTTQVEDPEVRKVLQRVASYRQLPIIRPVIGTSLGRAELLAKLKEKVVKELPPRVLELQGESFRAIELIPIEYEFEAGILKLLQEQIAGFYDPEDDGMYLLDDLSETLKEETLDHELVHALQDQSFDLQPMLKFKAGEGDATAAAQALIEGDATSAMIDVGTDTEGAGMNVDIGAMRKLMSVSSAFSSDTPAFLQETLVSPYVDGLAFVNALRRRDGWPGVDRAFRALPTTTEQILHPEKFIARELAVVVPTPSITALGAGFRADLVDSMGELGMRLAFETAYPRDLAAKAAQGWGGDRYVVASKSSSAGMTYALVWSGVMDTRDDAVELSKAFEKLFGAQGCKERPSLGPLSWIVDDKRFHLVAGPYTRVGGKATSAGDCALVAGVKLPAP